MTTIKNTEHKANDRTRADHATRITFTGTRWGSRPARPRLVSFSWGAVAPSMTRR